MRTLKMDGMEKIMLGMTDLKMVWQVCIKEQADNSKPHPLLCDKVTQMG